MTYLSDSEGKHLLGFSRCSNCRALKPIEEFPRNRSAKSGRGTYCKPCHNEISRRNRERLHGSVRNYMLKHRYGITAEDLARMVQEQERLCAICRERPARHVD